MCWAPSTCGMSPPPTWSASCAASMSCSTGWPRSCVSAPCPAREPSCSGSSLSWQPSECLWGPMGCVADSFSLTPPSLVSMLPHQDVVLKWGSVGTATPPEGLWVSCSQPQGTKEPQLLLCRHVWPQQLGHQPPGPHLGGRWFLEGVAAPLPTPVLRWDPTPILGTGPLCGQDPEQPHLHLPLLSQRLPHKIRKLYSALERLLVSAGPRPVPPETLLLGFPAALLLVFGHCQGF